MTRPVGEMADFELEAEIATAGEQRRKAISAEIDERTRSRQAQRGHDPELCNHPIYCCLTLRAAAR
jgi:hypothetical protein